MLRRWYPDCELRCFGSFASGLYLPTADMDLVLLSPQFIAGGLPVYGQVKKWLYKCSDQLLRADGLVLPGSMEVIAKARVPILKFVDRATNLHVDISFENTTGLIANGTFQEWKKEYPAMPKLATLVKQFVLMRGLNEVYNGGVGGFSIVCLVVSFLQHHPATQSKNITPDHHLGDLFMNFLDLYGNKFNLDTTGISMEPAGYFPKSVSHSHFFPHSSLANRLR